MTKPSVLSVLMATVALTASFTAAADAFTPLGAEAAGNADGSIPAWTGGFSRGVTWNDIPKQFVDPFASDPVKFPPVTEALTFGYLAGALLSTSILSGEMSKLRSRLKRQSRELSDALETIRVLATVDELTSLVNRRHMHEVLEAEERRQPDDRGTCIALLDIDFFKQVNDQFGHAGGDAVLRSFSAAARASLRANDVLARWGGEEFLLLLPDAAPEDARHVLERMAERVHGMPVPGVQGRRISFSAGLATRRAGEPFADAIHRADKALYQAKEAGRDRIVLA